MVTRIERILQAAGDGEDSAFESEIDRNPELVDKSGLHPYGWGYAVSPLHMAVQWGQKEKVEYLLDKGVDIDFPDGNGSTPLHIALLYRRMEVAQLLVERGAEPDIYSAAALGYLDRRSAMLAENPNLASILDGYWHSSPLHCAGSVDAVDLLIEFGADPSHMDERGNTPTRWAVGFQSVRPGVVYT